MFLMLSSDQKKERWLKLSIEQKAKYWKVMQNNFFEDVQSERKSIIKPRRILSINKNMFYEEESWNSSISSPLAARVHYDSIIEEGEKEEESGLKSGRSNQRDSEEFESICSPLTNGTDQKKDFPQDIEVKPIQLELWESTVINDPDSIYELWFKCFDIFQQISLWNKLKFPAEYFKETDAKIDTSKGMGSLVKFVTEGPISSKKIQRILKLKLNRRKIFQHVYEVCLPLKDYKTLLWIPMSLKDKIKLTL